MLHALKIIDFNQQDYFFSLELLAMSNHSFSNLFGASSSSGFGTSLPVKTWACATDNLSYKAVISNTKPTSNITNWKDSYSSVTNKNNTSNHSSQLKKTRSHSAYPRSSNHHNSEFSQLLPVSTSGNVAEINEEYVEKRSNS